MEKQRRRKPFRHINQSDRDRIEILLDKGHLQREIADLLEFNKSSISRERKRRQVKKAGRYDAQVAEHKARNKRANSKYQGMKIEKDEKLKQYIIRNLIKKRSPDEIAGRMQLDKMPFYAGKDAIYKWLFSVYGEQYCKYLCTRRKKRRKQKKKTKREMIPDRISIWERSMEAGIYHSEGDLFVSPRSARTPVSGALVCNIASKLLAAEKILNRKPNSMVEAINKINQRVVIGDLTLDNGIENKNHKQFNMPAYFCDSHSPWQKPHVENNIGLLRRWFIPKKTNLKLISDNKLQKYISILNNKYRKSLGYRSAIEVAREIGILR